MYHGFEHGIDRLGACGVGTPFGSYGGVILMGLGLLVLVGLVVWFVWSQRSAGTYVAAQTTAPAAAHADPALDIVRGRYARGEIDREEYERLLADLRR